MRSLVGPVALALALSGCGTTAAAPTTSAVPAASTSAVPAVVPTTSTSVTTSVAPPPSTTTTTVPYRELLITGTGKVYTLEESQAFGEFGPLLWNLVTTLNGTDRIEHGPGHKWVIWGPMWGGRIDDHMTWRDTYGVTDLDAVDRVEVAAAVPAGEVIVLREVPWSLDELNDFSDRLREISLQLHSDGCGIDAQLRPGERTLVRAKPEHVFHVVREWTRRGLPLEVLAFEPPRAYCLLSVYWPAIDPPTIPPAPRALTAQ